MAALLLFVALAAAAVLLSGGQNEQRQSAERRFAERAQISAALTQSVFGALGSASGEDLQRRLGGDPARIRRELLPMLRKSRLRFIAVLDRRGQVLASAGKLPPRLALRRAANGGEPLFDVEGAGAARVIEYAIPFGPKARPRALVEGVPLRLMTAFLDDYLARLRNGDGIGVSLIDSRGQVISRKGQIAAPGTAGPDRLATAAPVPGSPWTLHLEAERARIAPVDSLRWLPWLLLGGLMLAAAIGLYLYTRTLAAARRQREANVAVQDSRDQMRNLVSALEEGVFLYHADGRTELLNDSAKALVAQDGDEMHGLEAGWETIDAAGVPLADEELPIKRVLATGLPVNVDVGLRRPDDLRRWLSVSARPLVRAGEDKPHAVVATCRDITDQREHELHLTELTQCDPLTGLWNRRRFEEDLAGQLARCRRYDEHAALVLVDVDGLKQLNDTLGHLAGDDVLRALADGLNRRLRASDSAARIGGDEFAVLLVNLDADAVRDLAEGVAARLTDFVREHFGPHVELSLSVGVAMLDRDSGGVAEAFAAADQAMYVDKRRCGRAPTTAISPEPMDAEPHLASLRVLLTAVQARDSYTATHSRQVVTLARGVARRLGLDDAETSEIESVALMHDLGKIAVPDSILHKRGPLSESEWTIMRQHPVVGGQMVASIPELSHLAPAVRAEHERWDGAGYPDGLVGEAIPLASRIAFVCDAYHAMTSDRPYRRALSPEAAMVEIEREAGRQFCPDSAVALLAVLRAERVAVPSRN